MATRPTAPHCGVCLCMPPWNVGAEFIQLLRGNLHNMRIPRANVSSQTRVGARDGATGRIES